MRRDKGYKGIGMEGRIARWYAKNTWKDIAAFRRLAERFAQETPADGHILEVAPGPGYLAIELAKCGQYAITGLDISHSFVEIARANAQKALVPRGENQQGFAPLWFLNRQLNDNLIVA